MTEENNKPIEVKEKIAAKPLPVDKEKAEEIQKQLEAKLMEAKKEAEDKPEEKKEVKTEPQETTKATDDSKDEQKAESKEEKKVDSKEEKKDEKKEEKTEEKKEPKKESKKKKDEKPKAKKYEAVAHGRSMPISKKQGMYICTFIKNKSIDKAISDLTLVINMKKAVPFKGEIPHRKGMMSGRYPVKASKLFINVLKSLKGNIVVNGLELDNSRITGASASWAARTLRTGGRSAKRTNVILTAKEITRRKK